MCGTIQEQVDPDIPFDEDFVTQKYKSYVRVLGNNYVNGSVPVKVSAVNLTCFYDSE